MTEILQLGSKQNYFRMWTIGYLLIEILFYQVMQGNINQMGPPVPQGHFMGRNPMPSGSGPPGNVPPGGIPNGLMNMQAPSNVGGSQMFPPAGAFNRPQTGQMQMMQGINPYQVYLELEF